MRDLIGKTAFVTGGASGIGFALGQALAQAGMKVMLADVEPPALDRAVAALQETGAAVRGIVCDVADRNAVQDAARATIAAFGKVHIVCNNAGVGAGGPTEQVAPADWQWVLGVNLMGVIHGIEAFLPRIKTQGEGGHIVNTASMAGMICAPQMGPYNTAKFGVVALSETLAAELAGSGIGVSVLCPGWVNTRILESGRNRPAQLGGVPSASIGGDQAGVIAEFVRSGMAPKEVAARVMAAIRDNDFYVFTHPGMRNWIEDRFRRILAAFDKAAAFEQ